MNEGTQGWFILGTLAMAIGSLVIWAMSRALRREDAHHGSLALAIPLVAMSAYFAMWQGQGVLEGGDHTSFIPRYLDWIVTTPLLLVSLAWVGLPPIQKVVDLRERQTLVGSAVLADVYMIVTGIVADRSPAGLVRDTWYIASCAGFLIVLALIWGRWRSEVSRLAGPGPLQAYTSLATLLSALWIAYPIVWLVGSTGLKVLPVTLETAVYTVLDVTAKVGFGIMLVAAVKRLQNVATPLPEESTLEATVREDGGRTPIR